MSERQRHRMSNNLEKRKRELKRLFCTRTGKQTASANRHTHPVTRWGAPPQLCHRDPYFQYSFSHSIQTTERACDNDNSIDHPNTRHLSTLYVGIKSFVHQQINLFHPKTDYSLKVKKQKTESLFYVILQNKCHLWFSCMQNKNI